MTQAGAAHSERILDKKLRAMSPTQWKTFENRLRRMADRQGLTFTKSRRRDPMAVGYGVFTLTDLHGCEESFVGLDYVDTLTLLHSHLTDREKNLRSAAESENSKLEMAVRDSARVAGMQLVRAHPMGSMFRDYGPWYLRRGGPSSGRFECAGTLDDMARHLKG